LVGYVIAFRFHLRELGVLPLKKLNGSDRS
jgi:hypothetical protein